MKAQMTCWVPGSRRDQAVSFPDSHQCTCSEEGVRRSFMQLQLSRRFSKASSIFCRISTLNHEHCALYGNMYIKNWNDTEISMAVAQRWHTNSWSIQYFYSAGMTKKPKIAKNILNNKRTSGGITMHDLKLYYREIVKKKKMLCMVLVEWQTGR